MEKSLFTSAHLLAKNTENDKPFRCQIFVHPLLVHYIRETTLIAIEINGFDYSNGALLLEFRNYEENSRIGSGNLKTAGRASQTHDEHGIIPATTQLKTDVSLETTNNTIIRSVLLYLPKGYLDGESHVVHPKENQLSSAIHIPLWPPKDLPIDLHIKAMIDTREVSISMCLS
ncbi:bardet-Biedl syndrome 2 protein [Caerostris extrusa]|uniref:Bardet-Biedl syndrome 2 protein n=1 Tax=Caerostris extrusa TaxID=172846 RepID=A0AAV4YDX8_CAEEX|nr:bardet-Biedl syndrome 2 protein [Caerostris extrusa]